MVACHDVAEARDRENVRRGVWSSERLHMGEFCNRCLSRQMFFA